MFQVIQTVKNIFLETFSTFIREALFQNTSNQIFSKMHNLTKTVLDFCLQISSHLMRPCLFTQPRPRLFQMAPGKLIVKICQSAPAWVVSGLGSCDLKFAADFCSSQSGQSLSSYWSLYPPPRALTGINFISYKKETGSVTGGPESHYPLQDEMTSSLLAPDPLHPLTNDILMMNTNFSQ